MNYTVTARKYRPLKFDDVKGQQHITETLRISVEKGRLHSGYLFSGPRGVGKTTTARIFARAVNCNNPTNGEPCNECMSCSNILEGKSIDVIEIDGASNNSVDDIRKLKENARYSPSVGKYKMYIIDEVHMLSSAAFNALLKILEEPPSHLLFVFATTEQHKVPATILSRCQRHEFRRMELHETVNHIQYIAEKENITIDKDSLFTIASKADGSMRDAQSIFDQVVAFSGTNIDYAKLVDALHLIDNIFFFKISKAGVACNLNEMLNLSKDIANKGYDLIECLGGLLEHYRNLLTVKVTGDTSLIQVSNEFAEQYKTHSSDFSKEDLIRILNLIASAEQAIKYSTQPKIRFELCLIQIASLPSALDIAELIAEIRNNKSLERPINAKQSPNQFTDAKPLHSTQTTEPVQKKTDIQSNKIVEPVVEYNTDTIIPKVKTSKETNNTIISNYTNIQDGWDDFVKQYGNATKGLHHLKGNYVEKIEFLEDSIIIKAENKYVYEKLESKKHDLSNYLLEFYGKRIDVKVIRQNKEHTKAMPDAQSNKQSIDESSFRKQNDEHNNTLQIEKDLMSIFGAKKIHR